MNDKIQIIKELKRHLQSQFGSNIRDVILFGSQAIDNSRVDSDYDILILLSENPDWNLKGKISDACYDIDLKYNIITDTHILAISELKTLRGKQPIFQNALSKGIYA